MFLPGESQGLVGGGGGTSWAAVPGVAQSRTRLKRLSSSSRVVKFIDTESRIVVTRAEGKG